MQTGLSEEEKEAHYKKVYDDAVTKLWEIFLELDKLEALKIEHLETSGQVPDSLKEEMKLAREQQEFENYVTLLKEVRERFGHDIEKIIVLYFLKHKGEAYYWHLCIRHKK